MKSNLSGVRLIFTLMMLIIVTNIYSQATPNKAIDGVYYLTFEEKGVGGKTKKMIMQLAENNGTKMLAVAACEKCFPSVYTYKAELSERFGKPVFYNSVGLYVFTYDKESFVIAMIDPHGKKDFGYLNFYSKNQAKAKAMTKQKIAEYASQL